MSNVEIYIATHKKTSLPNNQEYIPIQVGAINKEDLGYLKDSTYDNISIKNPNYCELTALYWMWKNSQADIIGLVHYRRYFFKNMYSKKIEKVISKRDIETYLKQYDIIIPKEDYIYKCDVEHQYGIKHNVEDYKKCREIIEEQEKDYLDAFDKVSKRKYFYPYNMFIMKKEKFDEYAKWVFDILFELEKRIDISDYSQYNQRIFGFLSERLFNVWLEKNNDLKIKKMYVNNIEENPVVYNLKNKIKSLVTCNKN